MTNRSSLARRRPAPANASRKNLTDTLVYEKCEDRNMLSASPSFQPVPQVLLAQEQVLLDHLASERDTSHLQQGSNDLLLVDVELDAAGTTAVFQQTINDLPVHGSYVTIVQGNNGAIENVINGTFADLAITDSLAGHMRFSHADLIANNEYPSVRDYASHGDLVWFSDGITAELAWQVRTSVIADRSNYMTVVDAQSGDVLSQVQAPAVTDSLIDTAETTIGIFPRIVINNPIGPAGSQAYAADTAFDPVVALPGCTGTLIAPDVVISARHCGVGAGSTVRFGTDSNSPIFTTTVQSSFLPDGPGSLLDGGDVAILTLNTNVPGAVATPMQLINETSGLAGQLASMIGFGLNGVGSVGHQGTSDGLRWGGENIIDVYGSPASASGSNIISTDFDNPTGTSNTIPSGSPIGVTFEATTAPGDSGGPVMVDFNGNWVIAGVLSGGTTNTSVYGDISWWTGTAIWKSDIEAAGGVFADSGQGSVLFDQTTYFFGDTVGITVNDSNGIAPVEVTVTSDSGDSETFNLTDNGGGNYTGSIGTAEAAPIVGDGILQGANSDQIEVTYDDPDDGTGSPVSVNDTATISQPGGGPGVLVGIDFDVAAAPAPTNWGSIGGGSNTTFNNLVDENGVASLVDLAIAELVDGNWLEFTATPDANTIPQDSNSLANIGGQIYTGADSLELTYSDLDPFVDYEIYVMAAESFYPTGISQTVTITGDGTPVSFDQVFAQDKLFVNDQIGDDTRMLSEYAQVITADSNGEIVIRVDPLGATQDVVLAGVAIQEVPVVGLINPDGTKFLDGVEAGGSLADAQFSDDIYYSLDPSPTANPLKQKVEVILLSEYTGGGTPGLFEFTLEASMNGGPQGDVIQVIELFNYQTGDFEIFDTRVATNSDTSVTVSVGGTISDYLDPLTDEIISRVSWDSTVFAGGTFFWSIDVDQWGWNIS